MNLSFLNETVVTYFCGRILPGAPYPGANRLPSSLTGAVAGSPFCAPRFGTGRSHQPGVGLNRRRWFAAIVALQSWRAVFCRSFYFCRLCRSFACWHLHPDRWLKMTNLFPCALAYRLDLLGEVGFCPETWFRFSLLPLRQMLWCLRDLTAAALRHLIYRWRAFRAGITARDPIGARTDRYSLRRFL